MVHKLFEFVDEILSDETTAMDAVCWSIFSACQISNRLSKEIQAFNLFRSRRLCFDRIYLYSFRYIDMKFLKALLVLYS